MSVSLQLTTGMIGALFGDDTFGEASPVAVAMSGIVDALDQHQLQNQTERLDDY